MTRRIAALIVTVNVTVCTFAAEYSLVAFDYDAAVCPSNDCFGVVAEMVSKRIEARTAPSDAAKTLAVRFALDDEIKGENAVVTVKNGTAAIRAGRFRGLVFGAGLLLRTARYAEKSFSLADGEYRFEPKKSLRMCYMARHFLNWYHLATPDELTTYIDDLALSGGRVDILEFDLDIEGRDTDRTNHRFSDTCVGDQRSCLRQTIAYSIRETGFVEEFLHCRIQFGTTYPKEL